MDKLNELLQKLGIDKELPKLDDTFKLSELFPKLDDFWQTVSLLTRIFVMVGPLILLGLGILYFFAPPKEANRKVGFRTPWGMGSVDAWRFTQRMAGALFGLTGFVMMLVMAKVANGYSAMDPVDALQAAGRGLMRQLLVILIVTVLCHLIPPVFYTWKGEFRFGKKPPRDPEPQ